MKEIACGSHPGFRSLCFTRFVVKGLSSIADIGISKQPHGCDRFCELVEFLAYPPFGLVCASSLERLIFEGTLDTSPLDDQLRVGGHPPFEQCSTSLLAPCPFLAP